jgi:hypothetical protein
MLPVDRRLIPINGLIALLRGEGGWPDTLGHAGIQRHQLEVPITSSEGDTRADALLYRLDPVLVLLCESKGGKNVDELQARKYLAVDLEDLKRAGAVPPALKHESAVPVQAMFVGNEDERAGLEQGLASLNIKAPLLTVGADRVRLSDTSGIPGLDDFDVSHSGGLPPARIPVDHQSPDPDILELLIQQVVTAQAALDDIVSVETICGRILPEWPVISPGTQGLFISRVADLLINLSRNEMRGQIEYERIKQTNTRGRLIVRQTPATNHPRGRTVGFQAQQRRAGEALQRSSQPPAQRQLSLDQLADEGGLADE